MRYTNHEPDDDDYDDDDIPTVPCRHCREEILEDAEQCPRCGMYQSDEDSPSEPKSRTWIVMMALALLAAVIMTLLG